MTIDELIELAAKHARTWAATPRSGSPTSPATPCAPRSRCVTIPHSTDPSDLYGADETAAGQENDGTFLWLATGDLPDGENPYAPGWAWLGSDFT